MNTQYQRYNELIKELANYDIEMVKPEDLSDALIEKLEQEFVKCLADTHSVRY